MKKFDAFITVLEIEHTTVSAENEQDACDKVHKILDRLVNEDMMDPVEAMNAIIEVRPVEESRTNYLDLE